MTDATRHIKWGKILQLFVLAAFVLFIQTGCGRSTEPITENTLSALVTQSPPEAEQISPNDERANPGPDKDKVFYGIWTVKRVLAYSEAGTYTTEDAGKLVGKELELSADKADVFLDLPADEAIVLASPEYRESMIAENHFLTEFQISFRRLGIEADYVTQIDVSGKDGILCTLLLRDPDTMILVAGGTYFELVREN
jgi:hypothetical protein